MDLKKARKNVKMEILILEMVAAQHAILKLIMLAAYSWVQQQTLVYIAYLWAYHRPLISSAEKECEEMEENLNQKNVKMEEQQLEMDEMTAE